MTCIVGLVEDGKVWLGGDSAGVDGSLGMQVRADRKVFTNDEFVMGFTTSFRMGNLLQHALSPPRQHPDDDVHKFLVTEFIDEVRNCLKKGGYARKENESESGGTFLVGYRGRLFYVDDDYQVGEMVDGIAACGCGADVALGSLFSTASTKLTPKRRVELALQAAERMSAGVRGPFHIISTKAWA